MGHRGEHFLHQTQKMFFCYYQFLSWLKSCKIFLCFSWKWDEEKGRPNITPSVNLPVFSAVLLVRISAGDHLRVCPGCGFLGSLCLPLHPSAFSFWGADGVSWALFSQTHSSPVGLDWFIFTLLFFFLRKRERQARSAQKSAILNSHLFF